MREYTIVLQYYVRRRTYICRAENYDAAYVMAVRMYENEHEVMSEVF